MLTGHALLGGVALAHMTSNFSFYPAYGLSPVQTALLKSVGLVLLISTVPFGGHNTALENPLTLTLTTGLAILLASLLHLRLRKRRDTFPLYGFPLLGAKGLFFQTFSCAGR